MNSRCAVPTYITDERLVEFEQSSWGRKYRAIGAIWRRNWNRVTPFFAYPPEVRKVLYTTNAIESLNMWLRKIIKNRGHFPSDDAVTKLLYIGACTSFPCFPS